MDELDRLFGLLVVALARETRVAVPFPASDVYERLVPYRSNRSRLNVATQQDYEMAVLRLLAGERSYVQIEPDTVREAMQREIATINPDPAYFRSFPDAQVMINGRAADQVKRPRREPVRVLRWRPAGQTRGALLPALRPAAGRRPEVPGLQRGARRRLGVLSVVRESDG